MKLKFDATQQFQLDAINSIVDIFKGQNRKNTNFTVAGDHLLGQVRTDLGIGNKLTLSDEQMLKNIQTIQKENLLPISRSIQNRNFTIEMETGTGKTYTYTRTIMELNKQYGLTKFVIVVPSVAIREGVYESLKLTKEHFKTLYPGQGFRYFLYNSSQLNELHDFSVSNIIEIMIINVDAFRKSFSDKEKETKANLIHRELENGIKPIGYIQAANPIVIIDEPQSVDHTKKAKEAIASLNPLCILRYSATHKETYNLMYRLSPIDAFEKRLVKRIEVLSLSEDKGHNNAYIRLIQTKKTSGYQAQIEIDVLSEGKIIRKVITINPNSRNDFYDLSGYREVYKGYVVSGISCQEDNEYVEFENGERLLKGQSFGNIDELTIKRAMIKASIETHLDKELSYISKGIKVLSLFFIDRVANYRIYINGTSEKGIYAKIFEEEYNRCKKLPKYQSLFKRDLPMLNATAEEVHQGYFAQDRKGLYKDTNEFRSFSTNDASAFEEIMKNKEKLLSFESKRRFIFSHSALREGWDNPNVFQVCTLIETKDPFTKRQKIGRGLRLPVNQDGERIFNENINILTIIANESYQDFAASLQKEIEEETGYTFNILNPNSFMTITSKDQKEIGYEQSKRIFDNLLEKKLINKEGRVLQLLKNQIANNTFEIDHAFINIKENIIQVIHQVCKKVPVSNKKDEGKVTLNKRAYLSDDFKKLWEKINKNSIYRINIDSKALIKACVHSIHGEMQQVPLFKVNAKKGVLGISNKGIEAEESSIRNMDVVHRVVKYPDIVRFIQDETKLKRSTIVKLLIESNRLEDIKKNPQWFMEEVTRIVKWHKKQMMLDGIKYEKINDEYLMTQFENDELKALTQQLKQNKDIFQYVKLPSRFKITTPLGAYNPNFAIVLEKNNKEILYFVAEINRR